MLLHCLWSSYRQNLSFQYYSDNHHYPYHRHHDNHRRHHRHYHPNNHFDTFFLSRLRFYFSDCCTSFILCPLFLFFFSFIHTNIRISAMVTFANNLGYDFFQYFWCCTLFFFARRISYAQHSAWVSEKRRSNEAKQGKTNN